MNSPRRPDSFTTAITLTELAILCGLILVVVSVFNPRAYAATTTVPRFPVMCDTNGYPVSPTNFPGHFDTNGAAATAQTNAITAAETNAAAIYIPLAGSTHLTGDLGAAGGVNWQITESSGAGKLDGGDWYSDGDGDTIQTGSVQQGGGVLDQYGNPIIDSSDQLHYGYGNGLLTDTVGQLYWSSWDYSNTVFLSNEGQVYAANGMQVLDYNADLTVSTITSDSSDIRSDGGGNLYATNFFGSFSGDGSSLSGTASGFTVGYATYADNLVGDVSYADEAGYAANAGQASGLSSNLPLDNVSGIDSSYYTPLAAAVDSSGTALVSRAGTDARTDDVIIAGMNMKTSWISCGFSGTSGSGTFSGANYDGMNLETGTTASSNVSVQPWYNFNRYSGVNFGEPFTVYFTVHGSGTQFTHNTLFFDFGTNGTISTSPASSNICEGWAFSGGNWTPYASNGTTETTGSAITGSGGFQTDSSNIYSLKMVHVPGTGLSLYIKNLTTGGSYSLVGTTANPGTGAATSYAFRIYLVNVGTAEDNGIGFVAMTFLNTAAY